MRLDPIVSRRFAELSVKAEDLLRNKQFSFRSSETGQECHTLPIGPFKAWATNVLNLLQRTFGEERVHDRLFNTHYLKSKEWESGQTTSRFETG